MRLRFSLVCLLGAVLVTGCKSSGTAFNPPGGSFIADRHMYLGTASGIAIFDLPVTSSSTPVGTIAAPDTYSSLFEDAKGRLFAPVFVFPYETIDVFTQPISASSSPAFTLTAPQGDVYTTAEDKSGNVYQSLCTGYIDVYDAPVTSTKSTESFAISNDLICPAGLAFDSDGNLYALDEVGYVDEFTPPFSSSSAPAVAAPLSDLGIVLGVGLAIDSSNRLFLPYYTGDAGAVAVFTQPLSDSSTPAFTIALGTTAAEFDAFDSSGNLWVDDVSGTLWEVKAPITSSSTATQVLTGLDEVGGIAFGQ